MVTENEYICEKQMYSLTINAVNETIDKMLNINE